MEEGRKTIKNRSRGNEKKKNNRGKNNENHQEKKQRQLPISGMRALTDNPTSVKTNNNNISNSMYRN